VKTFPNYSADPKGQNYSVLQVPIDQTQTLAWISRECVGQ
jgi:hypothetical protein